MRFGRKFAPIGMLLAFRIAIVEKDKIVYSKGFGLIQIKNKKTPVTPNTLFANRIFLQSLHLGATGITRAEEKVRLRTRRPGKVYSRIRFNKD